MRKFFQIAPFILVLLLSPNSEARESAAPADRMRIHWWYYGMVSVEPSPEPAVVLSCRYPIANPGVSILAGALGQANIGMPIGPEIGAELEFCINRYSYANWAPSRVGIGLLAGYNKLGDTWFINFGPVIKYQLPISERLDSGFYWKYNFLTDKINQAEDRHTFVFGILSEFRPLYNGNEENQHPLSGVIFIARAGFGTSYFPGTISYGFVFEFLLGAGYRFADF